MHPIAIASIVISIVFMHMPMRGSEVSSNQSIIQSYAFTSPVKKDVIAALYTQSTWRQCFSSPIPTDPTTLAFDLTAKAKAYIAHFRRHAATNGSVARKLSTIYQALPAGNSPQKVRTQKYKKNDTSKLEETLSAAAAVAQLKKNKTMQEIINPVVREIRASVQQDSALASPVHRPLNTIFAQQKPIVPEKPVLASAPHEENQENIPPQLALPSPARKADANTVTTVKIGKKRKERPTPAKPRTQSSKTKTEKAPDLSKTSPAQLTHEKIEKERQQKNKRWKTAGENNQKVTSFFTQ